MAKIGEKEQAKIGEKEQSAKGEKATPKEGEATPKRPVIGKPLPKREIAQKWLVAKCEPQEDATIPPPAKKKAKKDKTEIAPTKPPEGSIQKSWAQLPEATSKAKGAYTYAPRKVQITSPPKKEEKAVGQMEDTGTKNVSGKESKMVQKEGQGAKGKSQDSKEKEPNAKPTDDQKNHPTDGSRA